MRYSKLSFVIGGLLILTGISVPSSTLIETLRTTPADLLDQLQLGATLFRIGFVVLGLLVIGLGRIPIWNSEIQRDTPRVDPHRKFNLVILAVVLFAAAALRLYKLGNGLWYDEIVTYVKYARAPFGEIITTYDSQNQHFLYSLLAHVSFLSFGESGWALRLPAVLFGVGSIWALYLLGRQVSNTREALLSAALLAFSYHHIWFSQNARGYTGLLFWTLFSSWLFLRGLHEARPQIWLLYAIAAALGVYTQMTMLFVVIGHFIIYLMIRLDRRSRLSEANSPIADRGQIWPKKWAGFFLGFCLAGFLTLQLHALVLPQVFGGIVGQESTVPAWTHPLWTLLEFVKAMKISFVGSIAAIVALIVFGAGFLSFTRTNPVVIQFLIIPALICAVVVIGMGHHLWPRFFFFTFGFGTLVIVRGTMLLGHVTTRLLNLASTKAVPIGSALCTGLILVSALSIPLAYAPKQDYLAALNFVEARKEQGDVIVTVGLATFTYKHFYKLDWETVETVEALNAIRSRANRT